MKRLLAAMVGAALMIGAVPASAQRNEVRDRADIHALLMSYGATIDARDFDAFGRLFGTDGVYVTRGHAAKGPEAAENMRQVFANSPNHFRSPNFHLFYNEVITFDGPDRAHVTSMSLYMVPDDKDRPIAAMSARYKDDVVRKDGHWLFASREVLPIVNGPQPK